MHLSILLKTRIKRSRSDLNPRKPQIPYLFNILALGIKSTLQHILLQILIPLDNVKPEHDFEHLLRVLWSLVS